MGREIRGLKRKQGIKDRGLKKKRILRKCNQSGIDEVTANLRTQVLENELI